jgi:hypothetical protein
LLFSSSPLTSIGLSSFTRGFRNELSRHSSSSDRAVDAEN